ncbi:S1/P1 Nuclease [Salegentibacter salinarum]|uniref:S1/P1 Nuclease n=1 Tax=Salegentibacter salinarum TaxID=447422 RepID=A0A2N0TX49_9FLAO|nr:S1/P1 nuclease [Salegentibacter salinarum]PKD19314.1 S1/P1 Nuclease [Salegentibacter salinarum]SKB93035.1 S1/P1 Nuclease [Salegentibacter salinarum]
MKKLLLFALVVLIGNTGFSNDNDWGKTGHRATGEIAENYLNKKAKKAIDKILNGQGLAFVANYADDIKSDPDFRQYGPWHYVNLAEGQTQYDTETANPKGDLYQAILKCKEVLKDENASKEDRQFYLKMLVHFVGDLHQPFHVGRASDKGGNDVQVRWYNQGSNIHRVWDSQMIDSYQMSYTELAANTKQLSRAQIKAIEDGEVIDWVYESGAMANELYDSVETGEKLGYEYMYHHLPTVLEQLQKGGIRLAKILNEIYG